MDVKRQLNVLLYPPELIVTDGAPAYKSVIIEKLPGTDHRICLQHKVRNVRKKPKVKKMIDQQTRTIIRHEDDYFRSLWDWYDGLIEG
ncbi:MAG: hypothetical protein ACTSYA_13025 [Candidatus Kariarchaeaceae archaeon]